MSLVRTLVDLLALGVPLRARPVLTANRTYYVRADGDDGNDGLSDVAGGAFLTVQKAVDTVAGLDLSIFDASINVGAGTFASFQLKPLTGAGSASISGTGAGTVISDAASSTIVAKGLMTWSVDHMELISSALDAVQAHNGAQILFGAGMKFGAAGRYHVNANFGGMVYLRNDYEIDGGGAVHWFADNQGRVIAAGVAITLSGTPAFVGQFAYAGNGSLVRVNANTFTGAASGSRYRTENGGIIYVGGAGTDYLPGDSAGAGTDPSAAPYGLYV